MLNCFDDRKWNSGTATLEINSLLVKVRVSSTNFEVVIRDFRELWNNKEWSSLRLESILKTKLGKRWGKKTFCYLNLAAHDPYLIVLNFFIALHTTSGSHTYWVTIYIQTQPYSISFASSLFLSSPLLFWNSSPNYSVVQFGSLFVFPFKKEDEWRTGVGWLYRLTQKKS